MNREDMARDYDRCFEAPVEEQPVPAVHGGELSHHLSGLWVNPSGRPLLGAALTSCALVSFPNQSVVVPSGGRDEKPVPVSTRPARAYRPLSSYDDNHSGIAQLFVDRYGEDIRCIRGSSDFLVFDPERGWMPDNRGHVVQLMAGLSRVLVTEVAQEYMSDRSGHSRVMLARACRVGNQPQIANILKLVQTDPRVQVAIDQVDTDPWKLALQNGVIDLRTGELQPFSRDYIALQRASVAFDAEAACPRWEQFIREIFSDNEELIRFVHKCCGYTLSGKTTEQKLLFLHGVGRNGKTVFLEVFQRLMGEYAKSASSQLIVEHRYNDTPAHLLADLEGARFVKVPETGENKPLAEACIKTITGGDKIQGAKKFKDPHEFVPQLKLWMSGNYRPRVTGRDEGIWRRICEIPFNRQFTDRDDNRDLKGTLMGELPGILNWALRGCLLWQREGLAAPDIVREAVRAYREGEDGLGSMLGECVESHEGGFVSGRDLHQAYSRVCMEYGELPLTHKLLNKELRSRGYVEGRDGNLGDRGWRNVRLISTSQDGA